MPEQDPGVAPMPDIQVQPNASPAEVFATFAQLDPQRFPQHKVEPNYPQPVAEPKVEPTPEPAPTKQEEPKSIIPEQFLGKKPEPEADEWDQMVKEDPKGPLKHENWKKFTQLSAKKVEALKAEIAAREAKIAEVEKRGIPDDVIARQKQLEDTLAEREAVLERLAVQESPKFKERFSTKENAIAERLKRTATEMGLDNETIQQALTSSLKRRTELMDNIDASPTVRGQIDSLMVQYDLLQDDKNNFLNQSKEETARWQSEQKETIARQDQERTANENRIFTEALDELSKTFAPFQEVEGHDAWNAQAKALREEAMKYLSGQVDLKPLAVAAAKGVASPILEKINARQHEIIEAQAKEIAAFKKAQPGSNGHIPTPDGKRDDRHLSPQQRAMQTFREIVGSAQNNGF